MAGGTGSYRGAPTAAPPEDATRLRPRRPWVRRLTVAGLAGAVVAFLVVSVRGELADAGAQLHHLRWGWLTVALAAGVATLVLFAGVRLVLLRAAGGRLSVGGTISLTYASGAIAASVPAGGAVATAYVFRQYRAAGADAGGATWALLINGVITPAVLAAIGLVAVAFASPSGVAAVVVPVAAAATFVIAAAVVLTRPHVLTRPVAAAMRLVRRARRQPVDTVDDDAHALTQRLAEVHPSTRDWGTAITLQLASWLVDAGCFAASIVAVGGTVPWRSLLAVYTAGQLVGRLPLLPAGLGQIETGLVVGLAAAGVPVAIGLAATLIYRVAEWIVVPIGWAAWWLRRRHSHEHPPLSETAPAPGQ